VPVSLDVTIGDLGEDDLASSIPSVKFTPRTTFGRPKGGCKLAPNGGYQILPARSKVSLLHSPKRAQSAPEKKAWE
jgi:hypothetical protein